MKELKLVGEHWKDNLPGLTLNSRLQEAINRKHLNDLWTEAFDKRIKGIHEGVSVLVTDKRRKILDCGFNEASDLILDNFGNWLAALIRTPVTAESYVTLTDIAPSSQTFTMWGTNGGGSNYSKFNEISTATGTQLQVGAGATAALRTNTNIQTAFGTAPESGRFGTGPGGYGGGTVTFAGSIAAGGSGTVTETGFFGVWEIYHSTSVKTIMLFHDVLLSGVSFVAGNSIFVNYAIVM